MHRRYIKHQYLKSPIYIETTLQFALNKFLTSGRREKRDKEMYMYGKFALLEKPITGLAQISSNTHK